MFLFVSFPLFCYLSHDLQIIVGYDAFLLKLSAGLLRLKFNDLP